MQAVKMSKTNKLILVRTNELTEYVRDLQHKLDNKAVGTKGRRDLEKFLKGSKAQLLVNKAILGVFR